jgi:hypothetical protein
MSLEQNKIIKKFPISAVNPKGKIITKVWELETDEDTAVVIVTDHDGKPLNE